VLYEVSFQIWYIWYTVVTFGCLPRLWNLALLQLLSTVGKWNTSQRNHSCLLTYQVEIFFRSLDSFRGNVPNILPIF